MSSAIYREFTLRTPAVWQAVVAFIKANAAACAEKDHPLRLIITAEERKRNDEQNRRYWGYVLRTIAEQAWVDSRQFDKDTWHEYFARMFGVCEEVGLPGGEIVIRRKSTTQMTVAEFSDYMTRVEVYAAQELGVQFDG